MRKIRLTESDLTRIVRRVINETDSDNDSAEVGMSGDAAKYLGIMLRKLRDDKKGNVTYLQTTDIIFDDKKCLIYRHFVDQFENDFKIKINEELFKRIVKQFLREFYGFEGEVSIDR